jgi:hypothetical protein
MTALATQFSRDSLTSSKPLAFIAGGDARLAPREWLDAGEARGPMKFDRRRLPRKVLKGGAVAVFTQAFCAGSVVRVELTDGSHTGLGVTSPVPVEPGTTFSLIPDHPMMPRAVGVSVRCDKLEDGTYAVGLKTRIGAVAA